jgi:arylsulfatase A-like enzyme
MSQSHVLIVVVDGLRASALGAYGNTSFPTPVLNQFAAESLLFDDCYAPAADLAAIYRALWCSRHPLRGRGQDRTDLALPLLLKRAGYRSTLATDDSELLSSSSAAAFDEQIACEGRGSGRESESAVIRTLALASEIVVSVSQNDIPQLVWVHLNGLYGLWNAPLALQEQLLDEGDPPPVTEATPPDFVLGENHDADLAFRYGCAYAAQIMLLDECWSGLLESLHEAGHGRQWLTMFLGARGFPLGEHQRVGGVDQRLYVEQLHVPWLIRFPDGRGRLCRVGGLVSHLDVLPTIADWVGIEMSHESSADAVYDGMSALSWAQQANREWRSELFSATDHARSLRTSEWSLRLPITEVDHAEADSAELYVRPDDRWEANDVAARCPAEVDRLIARVSTLTAQIAAGEPVHQGPDAAAP